jgi:pimeloyl-ACP methyl ester carboxylesterase
MVALATGLRYHVLEWGADDPSLDHTVVLVHGFLDLAWGWEATVRAGLAGRFHLVAPDMRGHGDSDRVGAGGYYHFMDYLADLHDLIAQRGRARVSIVGHSMGGSVASYYAGTHPQRVHRLALLEGLGPLEMSMSAPERIATWTEHWRRTLQAPVRRHASIDEAAERLRAHDPLLDAGLARELARHGTRPTGDPDGSVCFKHDPVHVTLGPYPFRVDIAAEFWRRITCPVLLVDGGGSALRHAPEEQARRRAHFADHRTEVLQGAGHMMQRHQPAALAALLADFLAHGGH